LLEIFNNRKPFVTQEEMDKLIKKAQIISSNDEELLKKNLFRDLATPDPKRI